MTQAERIADLEARVSHLEDEIIARMDKLRDLMREVVAANREPRKPLHVVSDQ